MIKLPPGQRADPQQVLTAIVDFLKQRVEEHHSDGITFGMSGGMDSAVLATLAVKAVRSLQVHALNLYERFSNPRSIDLARDLAEQQNGGVMWWARPSLLVFSLSATCLAARPMVI